MFCAPVLTYETVYPRNTEAPRLGYIIKRVGIALISTLIFALCLSQVQLLLIIEHPGLPWNGDIPTLLRIAFASQLMHYCGFFVVFYCLLDLFAEVFGFADRHFYEDWWNSRDLNEFWRKWNSPVHEWFLRHVYAESVYTLKFSKKSATTLVFLVSAVLHEYFFTMAFSSTIPCFFIGMALQAPIMFINSALGISKFPRLSNILVWVPLAFSQNLLGFVYYRDWLAATNPSNYSRQFWCPLA